MVQYGLSTLKKKISEAMEKVRERERARAREKEREREGERDLNLYKTYFGVFKETLIYLRVRVRKIVRERQRESKRE